MHQTTTYSKLENVYFFIMASKASSNSKLTGILDVKHFLSLATKHKEALFDVDVLEGLPNEDHATILGFCSEFAAKCKRLKPTVLNLHDSHLIMGMLLVDGRMLRESVHKQSAEIAQLKNVVKRVEKLNESTSEDSESKAVAQDFKTVLKQHVGAKLFQVIPFAHTKQIKSYTRDSLEAMGLTPESEFGVACKSLLYSYYKRHQHLVNARLYGKVSQDTDRWRLIWYDHQIAQFYLRDNAKRRTTLKHGLNKILTAWRSENGISFGDNSFEEIAAAILDVALVKRNKESSDIIQPMNEKQVRKHKCVVTQLSAIVTHRI